MNVMNRSWWMMVVAGALALVALFYFALPSWVEVALFALGLVLGVGLMAVDQMQGWRWYNDRVAEDDVSAPHLITRSAIFLTAWLPLTLFVTTSTGSSIGVGMVLAIGWVIISESWLLRDSLAAFSEHFWWQIHRPLTAAEQQRLTLGFSGAWLVLAGVAFLR